MFVLLRGRSRLEAFRIGREMEQAVTALNPKPVKLKFEKVLHHSIDTFLEKNVSISIQGWVMDL